MAHLVGVAASWGRAARGLRTAVRITNRTVPLGGGYLDILAVADSE
jgi:hypothetical protein